jgi:hypothetical protein
MNTIKSNKKKLSPEQREELLGALKARFDKNMNHHRELEWQEFEVERIDSAEYLLKRKTARRNEGSKLLLAAGQGWFQPIDRTETTDDIAAPSSDDLPHRRQRSK